MAKLIQTFHGFSGNQIYLMEDSKLFVRKVGKVARNVERMTALRNMSYPVPYIYRYSDITMDMEYIHGLDMKTYLMSHQPNNLVKFLVELIEQLKDKSIDRDYTDVYNKKLDEIDFTLLPFTRTELLARLPSTFPSSTYVGDLTLENIIYTEQDGFILIDCATIEYDSYVFDIAKLRQDLDLHWFTRNTDLVLDVKTNHISQQLLERYPEADNDYILILQLLRVYRHAVPDTLEHNFLLEGINRLWK